MLPRNEAALYFVNATWQGSEMPVKYWNNVPEASIIEYSLARLGREPVAWSQQHPDESPDLLNPRCIGRRLQSRFHVPYRPP